MLYQFPGYVLKTFLQRRGPRIAASLTYTTLLAIVPLSLFGVALLSATPVFEPYLAALQDFIYRNFIPESGGSVFAYIQQVTQSTQKIQGLNLIALTVVLLLAMHSIDKAFNDIWEQQQPRAFFPSLLVYWSILTLAPLLMGLALYISSYVLLQAIDLGLEAPGWQIRLTGLLPFVIAFACFTLLYKIVPNSPVSTRHALSGALLAAVLFELSKRGFSYYVQHLSIYPTIYGAFSVLPVFMLWLYISWVVVLLGAQVTRCITTFQEERARVLEVSGGRLDFLFAFRLIGHLWQAQKNGEVLDVQHLQLMEPELTEGHVLSILERLEQAKIIHRTWGGYWSLTRDVSELTLLQLYYCSPFVLPDSSGAWRGRDPWNQALARLATEVGNNIDVVFAVSLKELYLSVGLLTHERPKSLLGKLNSF